MSREVNVARLRDLLGQMNEAHQRLDALAQLSEDRFLEDYHNTESAKYLLIVALAAAIAICNRIAARRGRAPEDYADCFAILASLRVAMPELADRFKQMARFRNLLVHGYGGVDNRRVFTILEQDLTALDRLQNTILDWLAAQKRKDRLRDGPFNHLYRGLPILVTVTTTLRYRAARGPSGCRWDR